MFNIQIILLLLISIGYFSKKFGIIKKEEGKVLSNILMNFMLPAVIISNFAKSELNIELGFMTVSALIILPVLLIVGKLLSSNYSDKTSKTYTLLVGTYWGATLAYPFILATFKEEGLKIFIFYDVVQAFFASTILPVIAQGKISSIGIKGVLLNPLFIALVVGLILNLTNFTLPVFDELLGLMSSGIVFIGLLIVGLNLEIDVKEWKKPIVIILVKTILGLALSLLLAYLFNLSGIYRSILILSATLPPSLMVMIFSEKYDLDKELAASTLTIALPISIVVMTLISIFI